MDAAAIRARLLDLIYENTQPGDGPGVYGQEEAADAILNEFVMLPRVAVEAAKVGDERPAFKPERFSGLKML